MEVHFLGKEPCENLTDELAELVREAKAVRETKSRERRERKAAGEVKKWVRGPRKPRRSKPATPSEGPSSAASASSQSTPSTGVSASSGASQSATPSYSLGSSPDPYESDSNGNFCGASNAGFPESTAPYASAVGSEDVSPLEPPDHDYTSLYEAHVFSDTGAVDPSLDGPLGDNDSLFGDSDNAHETTTDSGPPTTNGIVPSTAGAFRDVEPPADEAITEASAFVWEDYGPADGDLPAIEDVDWNDFTS